jgi:hypothetical protein
MRLISLRFVLAGLVLAGFLPMLSAQPDWDGARGLLERSQQHLQMISTVSTMTAKERGRYDDALRHLSEFNQGLALSRFDGGKLDALAGDIDKVCKNNPLAPWERDVLLADSRRLRLLKSDWKVSANVQGSGSQ